MIRLQKKVSLGALAILIPFFAAAQDVASFDKEVARCQAMSDKAESQACITKLLTKTWNVTTVTDKLDGSKTIALTIMSPDKVSNGLGRQLEPFLGIRCLKGQTRLMLTWPAFLGLQSIPVKWRVDDQAVVSERWGGATDGTMAFASNPIDLTKRMLGKKEVVFNVEPYGKAASSASFDLSGLEEAIKPLREACKW